MSAADDRFSIIATLDRYAEALDTRDWDLLGQVFTENAIIDWGEWKQTGLAEVTTSIRSYLDGCGPSQHLLGNYRIDINGDQATSRHYCRVMHMGKGEHAGKTYETWIEYKDELERVGGAASNAWLSRRRDARAIMDQGDRSLLGPG